MVLGVVAVAQLMVTLDSTIVNIALPSAQHSLGFPNSGRQWVVTAYALAFGSLLLPGGRIGDMFSRKRVFIIGLVGFSVASAIGGAADSFAMLIAARTLQGAFGAILAPAALGTPVSTFTDPRERGKAFGVFGSVAAGGGAVGLILGGVLTQYLSWRYTLYVNLVFAVIAIAGALIYIRGSRPTIRPRMDWPGAVLACAGLFLLGFGMIFSPAINTATAGVRREDSGVASALVNTMQQVGGSIGTSALSTIALTATTSYLALHHASALAPAIAATHGYTVAFAVSAALLGLGVIITLVLIPSRHRVAELRKAAAIPAPALTPVPHPEPHAIPVALVCCSPVITAATRSDEVSTDSVDHVLLP